MSALKFLCMPTDLAGAYKVPGSVSKNCDECGIEVWMAPSSVDVYESTESKAIVCLRCARPEEVDEVIPPTEAQQREIDQWKERQ